MAVPAKNPLDETSPPRNRQNAGRPLPGIAGRGRPKRIRNARTLGYQPQVANAPYRASTVTSSAMR
jgi:hypothetical protein